MKAPGAKQPHPHGREQAPYYERCAVLNVVVAAAAAVLHRNVSDDTMVQTIEVSFSVLAWHCDLQRILPLSPSYFAHSPAITCHAGAT